MNFARWLNRIIGPKPEFVKIYKWTERDIYRWCTGSNAPKAPNLAQLLYDISIYKNLEYSSLVCDAMKELQKDYREKQHEKSKSNSSTRN